MAKTTTKTRQQTVAAPAITQRQLEEMLANQKGATMVTVVTRTEPRMRKTGNPFVGRVFMISRVNGVANFIYGNSVNRQREREGTEADFQAEPRKWGERVKGTPLVLHKGQMYLELKVERSLGHTYVFANGSALTDTDVTSLKGFLYKSSQAKTQQTDKEIILRDYKVANIVAITMGRIRYTIVPMP